VYVRGELRLRARAYAALFVSANATLTAPEASSAENRTLATAFMATSVDPA
jgi:hypothetical protein